MLSVASVAAAVTPVAAAVTSVAAAMMAAVAVRSGSAVRVVRSRIMVIVHPAVVSCVVMRVTTKVFPVPMAAERTNHANPIRRPNRNRTATRNRTSTIPVRATHHRTSNIVVRANKRPAPSRLD